MIQKRVLLLLMLTSFFLNAQDMQEGFTYLESGKYKEAQLFFDQILKEYPENRTAKLCYGRALGLQGKSAEAVAIFSKLKLQYPNDFEIKLNHAESLLWDKQFSEAEEIYPKLIEEEPTNFSAILGYANTLSNLKKYPLALEWVGKALQLQPTNTNALVSRKYIRLGYAFTLSQQKKYNEALIVLTQNFEDFPGDKDTLLNMATIFLVTDRFSEAEKAYIQIAKTPKDSILSLNGLALVSHKQHKNRKALTLATKAKQLVEVYTKDQELWLTTNERYIQALLWNRKFKVAQREIDSLKSKLPNTEKVLGLQASYGMYTGDFTNSIDVYQNILKLNNNSFDGNLGIANAYRASGADMRAYEYAFKTLAFYPNQKDAETLIKALKLSHTPFVEEKTSFTMDNGDNQAFSTTIFTEIPFSTKFKTILGYTYRTTENTRTNVSAVSNDFSLGATYRYNGNLSVLGKIGVNKSSAITAAYTQPTATFKIITKPWKLQNLELGYTRELQNFNADLIDREIVMNTYFATYNVGTNFNLGWYTQYLYTSQTDENQRNLLFTSLYYNFLQKPIVKAGLNYQYISFKNQLPTVYFSPNQFHLGEVFTEVVSDPKNPWIYRASGAFGQQWVEDNSASTTYRAEGDLGYRFSPRLRINLYGKYSNIASATAAGFEFVEFGGKLRWYFLKKPIFDNKLLKNKPINPLD